MEQTDNSNIGINSYSDVSHNVSNEVIDEVITEVIKATIIGKKIDVIMVSIQNECLSLK